MTPIPVDLSIIIPAYNEAATIADSLDRLAAFLNTRKYGTVEVILVISESPDGTMAIAKSKVGLFPHIRLIDAGPRAGKGYNVRIGMFEATGRYKVFMDADLATPLIHLDDIYAGMQRGDAVMIATRDLVKIHKDFMRKFMSTFGNVFAQIVILPGIKDTQCGFKAFEATAAEAIFSRQTMLGWSFDAEILKIARLLGYHITTIQAPDWADPKAAGMSLVGDAPMKAAIKTFVDILIIRWDVWTGKYRRPSYAHKSIYN